jgi:hypothetical protein
MSGKQAKKQRQQAAYQEGYAAGYKEGWEAAISHWWAGMQRMNDELFSLGAATHYTFGIVIAGFGNTPRTMLKTLSGKIAEAIDRIQSEWQRMEQVTQRIIDRQALQLLVAEADELKGALKAMYSGEDRTGERLRVIAANFNPTMRQNILLRPQLQPGVKRRELIDRLCARAKPYREAHKTWDEIYDQLVADTENDPAAQDELNFLADWSVDSLKKAYGIRYPATLTVSGK